MCIEYVISFVILFVIAIIAIVLAVKVGKLEEEIDDLMESNQWKDNTIFAQGVEIDLLSSELAKKDSLISILRLEIEEKENM